MSHTPGTSVRVRGRIGGLTRAALAPSPGAITQAARDARWAKYVSQVREALPDLTDETEINRRAGLLQRADMTRLSALASQARSRAAAARRTAEQAEAALAEIGPGEA